MAEAQPLADGYLDLYKLAVEMADRVSARRTTANTFFLTIQTALVALLGSGGFEDRSIAGAGFLLAGTWWLLLRSYRDLNRAKFRVIVDLERDLPIGIFGREWEYLKGDPVPWWRGRYAELGTVERVVPVIFAVVYGVAFV